MKLSMRIWGRFLFTRSELLGVAGLALIIILMRVVASALPAAVAEPPDPEVLPEARKVSSGHHVQAGSPEPRNSPSKLAPFTEPASGVVSRRQTVQRRVVVEINGADTIKLQELTGIGPAFARRIVKYRDMLGGYAYPEQLLQVYGMDSARYLSFIGEVTVDTSLIRRINVNDATFRDLLRHPYLEFDQVKAICNYRDRKGGISNPPELWTAGILPDTLRKWIEPYLKTR